MAKNAAIARWAGPLLALLALGPPARAEPELEPSAAGLLPVPDLLRPAPPPPDATPGKTAGGCGEAPLPPVGERLPFGPGEVLAYEVTLFGIRTGRVALRMGDKSEVDQVPVYPIYAHARTTGFLSVLGTLDGRMVSFFDPETLGPVRMANRFFISTLGQSDIVAREDAAFAGPAVSARLSYRWIDGSKRTQTRPARLKSTSDLVDVLSVVYYMRSRALEADDAFCFEIYHRRRLWRVEGRVGAVETVSTPYGSRRARRIEGTLKKLGGNGETREIKAWVSTDADRLPLLVETPDRFGTLAVKLTDFARGRRLVRAR